jgi:hypothetical protein
MFWAPPNWMGLLLAAVLFSMVLAVTPFVTPRGQITASPDQVAAQRAFLPTTSAGVHRATLVELPAQAFTMP